MIIVSCSHGKHLAKNIANKLKKPYSELEFKRFPDGEIYLRFLKNVKNKTVVLIQSFYDNINDNLIEAMFAAHTAKDLGAKKVFLAAPYFPYLRQDKRFKPGECISLRETARLIDNCVDQISIIDPHLHREKDLHHIFKTKSLKLTSNPYIASYIKKNIKNPLIIGPDWESYKWAKSVAELIGCESLILQKKRLTGRKVKITLSKKIDLKGKNIVIVDDIISTGNTIIETVNNLKRLGAKKFTCLGVHGILVEDALKKLKKANVGVITTNTIPNKAAKIDISGLIAESLK
ncbi:ribose-phosphate diphosphokinase [Candidatus Woesearchaeota archaeon]|nr:ribose-phosphate diphosphokinase [Candidatus Woesearchaeota archaeon]